MKLYNPTIGNDPELFIKKGIHLIPAESVVANRSHPRFIKVDNAALEIHPGPFQCLQQQNAAIARQITAVRKLLGEEYKISLRTCERIRPSDLTKYKSLTSFGCEPSLVYHPDLGVIPSTPQVDPMKVRERSIGFHVHLGSRTPLAIKRNLDQIKKNIYYNDISFNASENMYKEELKVAELLHTTEGRARLVQACDLLAGLPAVLIDRDARQVWRRRLLGYGKAGEFREQKHGFEYRTLGPWPLYHPMFAWWANAAVRDAFIAVINDLDLEIKKKVSMVDVADAINTNSSAKAVPIWNKIKKTIGTAFHRPGKGSHPWHPDNIRAFEFIIASGGLKFVLAKKLGSEIWATETEESGSKKWDAYYLGFPACVEHILKDTKIKENYEDFTRSWNIEKDNLSAHIL